MSKHEFGGIWTKIKLEIVGKYLGAYNKALGKQKVRRLYADAFAGTGTVDTPVVEVQGELIPIEEMQGSARIALNADFHEYYFNDLNPEHVAALRTLKAQYPSKQVWVTQYDANTFIEKFCDHLKPHDRAVLFIDPYSTELRWESLEAIAKCENIDLWLLFPISALARITPKKGAAPAWEGKVTSMLGNDGWKKEIYITEPAPTTADIFGEEPQELSIKRIDAKGLQGYITSRLRSIFQYASEPLELRNSKTPIFLLYFAITNPSPAAQGLAQKIVKDILSKSRPH